MRLVENFQFSMTYVQNIFCVIVKSTSLSIIRNVIIFRIFVLASFEAKEEITNAPNFQFLRMEDDKLFILEYDARFSLIHLKLINKSNLLSFPIVMQMRFPLINFRKHINCGIYLQWYLKSKTLVNFNNEKRKCKITHAH